MEHVEVNMLTIDQSRNKERRALRISIGAGLSRFMNTLTTILNADLPKWNVSSREALEWIE